jgi:hypothetical protein
MSYLYGDWPSNSRSSHPITLTAPIPASGQVAVWNEFSPPHFFSNMLLPSLEMKEQIQSLMAPT